MTPIDSQSDDREQRYHEFVALLSRHEASIRRFVRSLLPSASSVDDVVQDTALECWKKFADFQPENADHAQAEFIRWACVIAKFKVLSWQRDQQRDRLIFTEGVIERLAAAAIDGICQQQRNAIEECLQSLPTHQRQLVLSTHSPGQSVAAIAIETGQSARRLYSNLNAIRKRLLNCVQQKLATETSNG
ncbi:MAG: sigma-70 family RNA polymerase sigma factor [Fuerstiella sp.]